MQILIIIYKMIPGNPDINVNTVYPIRTIEGSMLKYSAIPPHTPLIRLSFDFVNFFIVVKFMLVYNACFVFCWCKDTVNFRKRGAVDNVVSNISDFLSIV